MPQRDSTEHLLEELHSSLTTTVNLAVSRMNKILKNTELPTKND